MEGQPLHSISGRSDIRVTEVDDDYITLKTVSGEIKSRPLAELRRVADRLTLNMPIHVDSVLGGSGSSRNQPETLLANLPDVEWMKLDERKHLVWVGRKTHELGTLKRADPYTVKLAISTLADAKVIANQKQISLLILTSHLSRASQFASLVFQGAQPKPLQGGTAYLISSEHLLALLAQHPDPNGELMELIPFVKVPSAEEAAARVREFDPDSEQETLTIGGPIVVVRFSHGARIAFGQ
jgi:hypothetical protein